MSDSTTTRFIIVQTPGIEDPDDSNRERDSPKNDTPCVSVDGSQIMFLPHPKYDIESPFMISGDFLYEVQRLRKDPSSWLLGNSVVQDGSIYVASIMDPTFLLLKYLSTSSDQANKENKGPLFREMSDILSGSGCPRLSILPKLKNFAPGKICDVKDVDEMKFYRINQEKMSMWLKAKVDRLCTILRERLKKIDHPMDTPEESDKEILVESLQLLSEYLPKEVLETLVTDGYSLKLSDVVGSKKRPRYGETVSGDADVSGCSSAAKNSSSTKPKQSAAQKKLAKINTKGMKSIFNYFNSPPVKKQKKN
eukprot:118706_1